MQFVSTTQEVYKSHNIKTPKQACNFQIPLRMCAIHTMQAPLHCNNVSMHNAQNWVRDLCSNMHTILIVHCTPILHSLMEVLYVKSIFELPPISWKVNEIYVNYLLCEISLNRIWNVLGKYDIIYCWNVCENHVQECEKSITGMKCALKFCEISLNFRCR